MAKYAGLDFDRPPEKFTPELHEALLKALFRCNSWIAVVMITDLFGRTERFNYPGVAGSANWTQRLHVPASKLAQERILPRVSELLREAGRA